MSLSQPRWFFFFFFFWLFCFSAPSTGPTVAGYTPAAKPGFLVLLPLFSATQLPAFRHFSFCPSHPPVTVRLCPLLLQIHPSLPVSSSQSSFL